MMGNVFQLQFYSHGFQRLVVEDEAKDVIDDIWRFDGAPIGDRWDPPEVFAENPLDEIPDIWACFGYPNVAAFNSRATTVLSPILDEAGELLPIKYRDETLNILNVTAVENCLDLRKTKFSQDRTSIVEYSFIAERITSSLFTLCQVKASILYTVEGIRDPDREFKPLVEKHRLTGVAFKQIWSDQSAR